MPNVDIAAATVALGLLIAAASPASAESVYLTNFVPGYEELQDTPDDAVIPQGYVAPLGFGTFRWGDTLAQVNEVTHQLQYVYINGVNDNDAKRIYKDRCRDAPKRLEYSCVSDKRAKLRRPDRSLVHSLIVVEYRMDVPLYLTDTDAYLHRAAFQFCASYLGNRDLDRMYYTPDQVTKDLRLCGVRLFFSIHRLPAPPLDRRLDAAKNPERVLRALKRAFGKPIQQSPFESTRSELLERYSWCPSQRGDRYIEALQCLSNVVYAYDHTSQEGVVMLATPLFYSYLTIQMIRHLPQRTWRSEEQYTALLSERPFLDYSDFRPFVCDECGPDAIKNLGRPGDIEKLRRANEPQ